MQLQSIEIDEHKWYLSQYCNRDVGYNDAVIDFIKSGYAEKFRDNFMKNKDNFKRIKDTGELEKILIEHDAKRLHELLGDMNEETK